MNDLDIKNFDAKKFLSLPLNSGHQYISTYPAFSFSNPEKTDPSSPLCGCIKGNFVRACGIPDDDVSRVASKLLSTRGDACIIIALNPYKSILVSLQDAQRYYVDYLKIMFPDVYITTNPRLQSILDHGETLLFQKRPQYAKLFVLRALRMMGYVKSDSVKSEPIKQALNTLG
jgi:hypothetical protein